MNPDADQNAGSDESLSGNFSVRWNDAEKKMIREGTKALHLKTPTAFVRMAVMRLADEVSRGSISVRPPKG